MARPQTGGGLRVKPEPKKPARKSGKKKSGEKSSNVSLIPGKSKIKTDVPLVNEPGDIDPNAYNVTADRVEAGQVDLTDPNFDYDQVTAGRLAERFMTKADYTLLDPADVQEEFGDITRGEMRENAAVASDLALQAIDTELQGLQNYAPTAANLQRQQIALDNTVNQEEKLRMLEMADPNMRADLEAQRERANAYAEGRVPDSILDRQLELGIQSKAADRAASGGFGKGSSAAMKAGQLMSAEARIGLSQYGDQLATSNMGMRRDTLVAEQQMATGGSQIQVMPSFSAGEAAMKIASEANAGNINARDALTSKVDQAQFAAEQEQEANKTNLLVASERDANQATLDLQAATTNVDNDIKTQISARELNSSERRFNVELRTNTEVSNAQLAFQAANANAGRQLETATSNRAIRVEVDRINKTMVFQDIQRQKAEKFAAAQAAAANAAANARAAMAASSNAAAIAAQQAEAEKDRAFQLQQQQQALDFYKENRSAAQTSAITNVAGGLIPKVPDIISGISGVLNLFGIGGGGGSVTETMENVRVDGADISVPSAY